MSHIVQGKTAENLACAYLEQRGLVLLERNFRCRLGELDLVMRDREQWVFVEVRSRRQNRYGSATETIDSRKQQRLLRTAAYYLQKYHLDVSCRFDVVAIDRAHSPPVLEWLQDAFQA